MKKSTLNTLLVGCLFLTLVAKAQKNMERPNILFCIADDASMKSFGAYGDTFVNTPSIDSLAKEGVVFNNAYNGNPKCSPARACILTGKYSWQLKEAADHNGRFPSEFKTYPQLLANEGYNIGFTGKGWGPGVYDTEDNPAGPEYSSIKLKPPYKGISDIDYASNFGVFLNEKGGENPFCFWLGAKEPHRAYELDSWKKAGRELKEAAVPPFYPDNDIVRGDLLDYANEVEWFDTQVGQAIQILKEKGLLNNTMIVVTSDHGMPFPRVKGQIYEEGFHIPLIVYWKGKIYPGRKVNDFVSFSDLAPTFMEVAGNKPHQQMTGGSLIKQLLSPKSGQIDPSRDHVLLGKERHDVGRSNQDGTDLAYPVRAIRNDSLLYVHNIIPERWPVGNPEYGFLNCDGSPTKTYLTDLQPGDKEYFFFEMNFDKRPEHELYNIQEDPHCINNLADLPKYAVQIKKLRAQMETELIAQGDPRTLGNGDVFDNYIYYGKRLDYNTGTRISPLNYVKQPE
ncbi:sulfatase [Arenibacter algicola]|uniref:sulfatase family protein n=1 Tax=Arenibacter algicola TaxID=616991 RepID=UPI001C07231B|nr:sulfatase [Arenibacter algicola]MBU2905335.1 sulfatase [Arenibacter algicola]